MTLQQNGYHADTCPPTTATNIRWLLCLSVLMLLALLLSLAPVNNGSRQVTGFLLVANCRLANSPATYAGCIAGWCGAGISGAVMQALFENPLAEPGLLASLTAQAWGLSPRYCLGKGTPQLGARAVCDCWRAYHHFKLLRFARRHLSTSRLLLAGVD